MRMTDRDEAMLEWLSIVRLADMEAIRWTLAGLAGASEPVSLRKAQQWVARLAEVGLVDRGRPTFRDGSIVWATHQAIGKTAPNLFRQTTRHEVAVAAVSARYVFHGYEWERDRKPVNRRVDHQVDGVAKKGDRVELVEVELTPKTTDRYRMIFENHSWRLDRDGVSRVVYFCDAGTERIVRREADTRVFHVQRPNVVTLPVFDVRGRWVGDSPHIWGSPPQGVSVAVELDGAFESATAGEVLR